MESGRGEVGAPHTHTFYISRHLPVFLHSTSFSCYFMIYTFLIIYISVIHNIVVTEYELFFLWLRQSWPEGVATAGLVWSAVALRL